MAFLRNINKLLFIRNCDKNAAVSFCRKNNAYFAVNIFKNIEINGILWYYIVKAFIRKVIVKMGEYGSKVCYKIIVLFIAMIMGYIAKKTKIVDGHSTKALSGILANITNPCLMIASLQIDRNDELLKAAGVVLTMSFIIHIAMSFISHFIFKGVKEKRNRGVYTYGLTYMNCGFMGYPIMQAMFPEHGLFYGVIYTVAFNILAWTHGIIVVDNTGNGKINWKKVFLNPCIIAVVLSFVMFISNIRLPAVVLEGVDMVGDMTFPLSMLIIGSLLADQKLSDLVKDIKLFGFSVLKLAVVPLAMLAVCLAIKNIIGVTICLVCITMCAAPTAATTAVVAEVYDGNSALAAKLVGITTLFSLISMPLVLIFAERILV